MIYEVRSQFKEIQSRPTAESCIQSRQKVIIFVMEA